MERTPSVNRSTLAVIALGISTLVFLNCFALLNSPRHNTVYHLDRPASVIFIPALANILLLAVVFFVALLATQRFLRLNRALWAVILCLLPWAVLRDALALLGKPFPHPLSVSLFGLGWVAAVVFSLSSAPVVLRIFGFIRELSLAILVAIGLLGCLTFLQTIWFGLRARHLNDNAIASVIAAPAQSQVHGRVLWIILDELAYRQLYEHRIPGLDLPAFDRFRAEATVFTDVQPVARYTEVAVPSLMTGESFSGMRSTASGHLLLHTTHGWQPFDERSTVFADADAMGYRSAVVGWYNPYCRILSSVLSSCFWTGESDLDDLFPSDRIASNLPYPLIRLFRKLPSFVIPSSRPGIDDLNEGKAHTRDFVQLSHAADAALADPRNTFLLLHLPVPHPSGIWDRHTHRFAIGRSSYVDNLALADIYLDHIRTVLSARHQWDNTTIVIMGDHGFRSHLIWRQTHAWSHDDQVASDNVHFDPRPAYLVKLPNQHTPLELNIPFSALETRPLLDQLLLGNITTPAQLQQWVVAHPSPATAPSR